MARRKFIAIAGLVLALGAFGYGLAELIRLRFAAGEMYPHYSSLRSDPLGTRALYESLREIPGVAVSRNYIPLRELQPAAGRTVLIVGLGAPTEDQPAEVSQEWMRQFASAGGRVVVASYPVSRGPSWLHADEDEPSSMAVQTDVSAGLGATRQGVSEVRNATALPTTAMPGGRPIRWRSGWYFTALHADWKVLYECDSRPVVIERPMGAGSVVMAADSYFLSNEAMVKDRHASLIAHLIGGRDVIFDETHLGVREELGIAGLARRHGFGVVLGALMVLAALFIWKGAVTFMPRDRDLAARLSGPVVSGKASSAGMVNLLRRAIKPGELLAVCIREWMRTLDRGSRMARMAPTVEKLAAPRLDEQGRRPPAVETYNAICITLMERKHGIQR